MKAVRARRYNRKFLVSLVPQLPWQIALRRIDELMQRNSFHNIFTRGAKTHFRNLSQRLTGNRSESSDEILPCYTWTLLCGRCPLTAFSAGFLTLDFNGRLLDESEKLIFPIFITKKIIIIEGLCKTSTIIIWSSHEVYFRKSYRLI